MIVTGCTSRQPNSVIRKMDGVWVTEWAWSQRWELQGVEAPSGNILSSRSLRLAFDNLKLCLFFPLLLLHLPTQHGTTLHLHTLAHTDTRPHVPGTLKTTARSQTLSVSKDVTLTYSDIVPLPTPRHTTCLHAQTHTYSFRACICQALFVNTCLQTHRHPTSSRTCSLSLLLIYLLIFKGLFLPLSRSLQSSSV